MGELYITAIFPTNIVSAIVIMITGSGVGRVHYKERILIIAVILGILLILSLA